MISILYYIGAMQWTIKKLGWILQSIIGTTVCESLICAANIFLGMSESPLLIRPYIKVNCNRYSKTIYFIYKKKLYLPMNQCAL